MKHKPAVIFAFLMLFTSLMFQNLNIVAAAASPQCEISNVKICTKAVADQFHIEFGRARPDLLSNQSPTRRQVAPPSAGPSRVRADYVETLVTVGCAGNTPENNDAVCGAALNSCPDPVAMQFWQWTRTVDGATGQPLTVFRRTANPPYVCLAPAAAQAAGVVVDPVAAVAAVVERDFRSLVVLRGAVRVAPSPETLVNYPTRFSTDAPGAYAIPVSILGRAVVITATAREYTWFLGESELTTAGPEVVHTFRAPGEPSPHVTITWSGTFTIAGDPVVRSVRGAATTTGPGTPLGVREVRSQYEAG